MRINNAGHYEYCRWAEKVNRAESASIHSVTPQQYFQQHMTPIRRQLLEGQRPAGCVECAAMEQHGKVSGREKQLLKIGVQIDQFDKRLASSPWVPILAKEHCSQLPQDWQIDLGNHCNAACVFCTPHSSSRLAQEWQRLNWIQELPPTNWTHDPQALETFVAALTATPWIRYLHFIGGETVITPAFGSILKALIRTGRHRSVTVGFTTNLTVWNSDVADLLTQFRVNVGLSIESMEPINEYVRWPSKQSVVHENLQRWQELAQQHGWLVQLRTTPTVFTIKSLLSVYDYAWTKPVSIESCNFLNEPAFMRPSVLPLNYRQSIITDMQYWLDQHIANNTTVINTRNPNSLQAQKHQDLQSYVNYLSTMPDESYLLPQLVEFIKQLERSRHNSVLTYLPEYEELFRSAGY